MDVIIVIVLFIFIWLIGYCFISKIGTIFDETVDKTKESEGTKLIYVGFDMPCLVEDFLARIEAADRKHTPIEVVTYSGTSDEMIKMLQEGALDYAVITVPNQNMDVEKVISKEISLKPEKLKTDMSNLHIDMVNYEYKSAVAMWIPYQISKEKELFSNLILQL